MRIGRNRWLFTTFCKGFNVRVWGYHFGVLSHTTHPVLWSERNGRGGHYLHVGRWCVRVLPRWVGIGRGKDSYSST